LRGETTFSEKALFKPMRVSEKPIDLTCIILAIRWNLTLDAQRPGRCRSGTGPAPLLTWANCNPSAQGSIVKSTNSTREQATASRWQPSRAEVGGVLRMTE
jgi:hypothetical protein